MDLLLWLLFAFLYLLALAAPLAVMVWFIRTLSRIQRDQATSVRILASIENELLSSRMAREP